MNNSIFSEEQMKCDSGYLNEMKPGETAIILSVEAEGGIRRRLIDLGFIDGTQICCVLTGRHRESSAFLIRNTLIALRREDSVLIRIRPVTDSSTNICGETICQAAECKQPTQQRDMDGGQT